MSQLQTQHPLLMVTEVLSFSVIVYHNGSTPTFSVEQIRQALIQQLPTDCGVSSMTCTLHGQYDHGPRTTAR